MTRAEPSPQASGESAPSVALSFRFQLLLLLISLVLMATATVGWIAYRTAGSLVTEAAIQAVGFAADTRRDLILNMVTRQHGRANLFIETLPNTCPPWSLMDRQCVLIQLQHLLEFERAEGIRLVRPGFPPVTVGRYPSDPASLIPFEQGQFGRFRGAAGGNSGYLIEAATTRGVTIRLAFDIPLLTVILSNRTDLGETGESFLADADGVLITPGRHVPAEQRIATFPMRECLAGRNGQALAPDERGIPVVHGFRHLPQFGGACLMAHIEQAEAFAPVRDLRNRLIAVSAFFALFATGCSVLLARMYARPIDRLTQRARALQSGDFESPMPVEGPREVRVFAHTFAGMAGSISHSLRVREAAEAERAGLLAREQAARRAAEVAVEGMNASLVALQRSENQLRLITDALPALVAYVDRDEIYRFNNLAYHTWFGRSPETLRGKAVKEVLGERAYDAVRPNLAAALAGHEVAFESVIPYPDGKPRFVRAVYIPDRSPSGEIRGYVSLVHDVSEAKAADTQREELLAQLESERGRLEAVLRQMPAGVVIAEAPTGRLVLANDQVREIFRQASVPLMGFGVDEGYQGLYPDGRAYAPDEWPLARSIAKGEVVVGEEVEGLRGDGTHAVLRVTSAPIRDREGAIVAGVMTLHDVTDQKRAEEEMIKASKMESIGVLAGGIAHDFNNMLTAVVGNLYLIRLAVQSDSALLKKVADTEKAALRARELTQQLLTFSKGGEPIKRVSSMAHLVTEAATFILKGANVRCTFRLAGDLWAVEVDEGQITQVIHNIVINAQQAMPEGGVVTIRAQNRTITDPDELPLPPGHYVAVSITDHGVGIPKKHLLRIFDPYFTTKSRGSGLGLATTYSIIKRHQGHVLVDSRPGVRTTFTLLLPASDKPLSPTGPVANAVIARASGSVLFMDDDPVIRELAAVMLAEFGYRTVCVPDGEQAVESYRETLSSGAPFDVVILDLTVPGAMGGKDTLSQLKKLDPAVTAIVSSGYSNDPVLARYEEHGFAAMLVKPYRGEDLHEVLSKVKHSHRA
ncbi:MAG: PAS domain-containing protein [Nitrospiria bacterium]